MIIRQRKRSNFIWNIKDEILGSSQKEQAKFITWHFDTIDIILKSDSLIIIDNGFRNNRDEIAIKDDCALSIFSFMCVFLELNTESARAKCSFHNKGRNLWDDDEFFQ